MAETTEPENKAKALAKVETSVCGLVLHTLEDMKTVAQLVLQSGLAPDSFNTAEKIFVGLQSGAEIGLKPMQALNSIVVIKGKPTLWGDAALALVKRSDLCEYCREYFELDGKRIDEKDLQYAELKDYPGGLVAVCETKAKRDPEPIISYFSVADAKLARLWGKKGKQGGITPWCTHPKRMLKYKARAFNLRDNFPDVLFGMHLTEEMYGEEPLPAPESDVPPRGERRMAVPSTAVDTTRAPVNGSKIVAATITPEKVAAEGLSVAVTKTEPAPVAEDKPACEFCKGSGIVKQQEDGCEAELFCDCPIGKQGLEAFLKVNPDCRPLVTFVCKECGQTFRYGKEEGKGVPCTCGKGLLVEVEKQPEPAEPVEDKKADDVKTLYIEVNAAFVALNGQDFIMFAAYVLCLDESEISPGSLTIDQLKQVKAYIETSGVTIE